MNEVVPNARVEGEMLLDGQDMRRWNSPTCGAASEMVFQKPNPFPKSIFDNVAYGMRLQGGRGSQLASAVEEA